MEGLDEVEALADGAVPSVLQGRLEVVALDHQLGAPGLHGRVLLDAVAVGDGEHAF
jgi:hypothetical protein